MACMEHECTQCSWATIDNSAGPAYCPKCWGTVRSTFDEQAEGPDCVVELDDGE